MATFSYGSSVELVLEEHDTIETTQSGWYRLSPHGLWDGTGELISGVIDFEVLTEFDGFSLVKEEKYNTSIEAIYIKYHGYAAPALNETETTWSSGQKPSTNDINWGTSGSISWEELPNGIPSSTIMLRYLQYRFVFRGA